MKLGIFLLLAIAGASSIGTVLPQDQGPGVVHNSTFHPAVKAVLLGVQAYDVYHAFWFHFLLASFFLNLAVCTYLRFPPTWRRYAMELPPTPPVAGLQENVRLHAEPSEGRLDLLRKRGYRFTPIKDGEYFLEKGKFVRLGPTIIHLSMFAIIIGAVMGGLTGIKNQVPIQVGQTVSSDDLFDTAFQKGKLAQKPASFDLRLDAFRMEFFPSGQVRQYYSDVTVTPRNGQPFKQTMWVNEPLVYEGQYFYQAFWGIGALTYSMENGTLVKIPLTQTKIGGYLSQPIDIGDKQYVYFLRALEEPGMLVNTKSFQPEAQLVPGMTQKVNGRLFKVDTYHLFSGMETKKDPGIPVVYFGCGLLIMGLIMIPFTHRELWLRKDEHGWVLAGRTHKGRVMLRREMEKVAELWGAEQAMPVPQDEIGVQAS